MAAACAARIWELFVVSSAVSHSRRRFNKRTGDRRMEMGKSTTAKAGVLPWRVRLCFGAGAISKNLINVVMAAFMLFFYVDVLGMNSLVVSGIILACKIWDIVNDPMMGILVDRTGSKREGKCRFWLKYFSVPGGICLALCMFMPELNSAGKIIWFAVTYLLQGMVSTILLIPINTMIGRLSGDPAVRATLQQSQGIFGLVTSFVVSGYTMAMVTSFGKGDMRTGFWIVGILYGIIFAASNLIVYFGTRGYDGDAGEPEADQAAAEAEKVRFKDIIKALISNKVWLSVIISTLFIYLVTGIESANIPFYFQYNFPGQDLYSIYSLCNVGGAFIPFLALPFFVKRLGNARTAALGCILAFFGYMFRFALKDVTVAVMVTGWLFQGVGQGLITSVLVLSIFDARVYGLWKTGIDNDAVLMSGFSSVYKIGLALGTPLIGIALKLVPYIEGAAQQESSVLELFRWLSSAVCGVMFIIPFVLFVLVTRKNEKNLPAMRAEIEARRLAAAEQDNA